MEKILVGEILSNSAVVDRIRPKLTIPQQIEYMRDKKGIKFNIISEDSATEFLRESNYYFKLKAFEKNYSKYSSGENAGKYFGLEFAYLQELSTLDMYLREQILSMTLDIEHYIKVQLLNDISEDNDEDGYSTVKKFLECRPEVLQGIQDKRRNSYCEDLICKYICAFAVWNIVEILSFGDLLELAALYYATTQNKRPVLNIGNFRIVKFLRNAAAHNNCLINNLRENSGQGFQQNREANAFVSSIPEISTNVRVKKMGNRFIHDFVATLYCFHTVVSSNKVKKHQMEKLKGLTDGRFTKHSEYFSGNQLLVSNYEFSKKVVDKFASMCI